MRIVVLILIVIQMTGCSSSTEVAQVSDNNTFRFDYNSESYEVVSRRVRGDGVQNFLLQKDDTDVVLRAVDADRNGWLEAVLLSRRDPVDLTTANAIYHAGIQDAKNRGLLRESEIDSMQGEPAVVRIEFARELMGKDLDRRTNTQITVVIFGDVKLKVGSVDRSTLRLNEAIDLGRADPFRELDINSDGLEDLVFDLPLSKIQGEPGTHVFCVSGSTRDGSLFRGCETVVFR